MTVYKEKVYGGDVDLVDESLMPESECSGLTNVITYDTLDLSKNNGDLELIEG